MKVKYLWIPFAVFLAALLPLRLYQVLNLIDPETGISSGDPYMLQILLGLTALFVLILMFMSIACKNIPERYEIRKNIFAGVFSILAGVSMLAESACFLLSFLSGQDKAPGLVQAILGVLAAAIFAMMGICSFTGRNLLERVPLLTLLPSVWCGVRLVFSFLRYTNVATNSSEMLDLLSTSFLLIFLFTQAKLLSGFTTPKTGKRAVVAGMSAVVLLFVFRLPALVQQVTAGGYQMDTSISYITELLLALYVFCVTVELSLHYSRPAELEEKENETGTEQFPPEEEEIRPQFFESLVPSHSPAGGRQTPRRNLPQPIPTEEAPAVKPDFPQPQSTQPDPPNNLDMDQIDRLIEDICKKNDFSGNLHEDGKKKVDMEKEK